MELSFFTEAKKVWNRMSQNNLPNEEPFELQLYKKFTDIFHVGNYYYYIFDIARVEFRFISPEVKKVLGYEAQEIDLAFFMSNVHPEDQHVFLNHETTVIDFFKKLPLEKIPLYKVSYDYRVRHQSGHYVRILQQVVALQYDDDKNLQVSMGVHTDISHLKTDKVSSLSFIGLSGEPSYYHVQVAPHYKPSPEIFTRREKEIVALLIKGLMSSEIAERLFISKHTVDTHRKNILAKTHTKSTHEFLSWVMSQGLV
ncbi:LuxR C-terminal-related transcriptional regulator [Flavobacterium caeni]|uniref:PAS fold-containing protein n=1 Tax=Flavobacterium caeni TaxID=490189 RepID=A0A1G5H211_9FLAO|nr:LuxR C-terminal-related transcriptional regulator [Flavobacterium caeni]SCY57701.1 PAS fold-containing protein [Flavobacterium caeni]